MKLQFDSLKTAISSLERAIKFACSDEMAGLHEDQKEVVRAGVIQNFEFTYELSWKFMKRWLENNLGSTYVDGISRKELFRIAAEHQLIDSVTSWFNYHESRNKITHTYDQKKATDVFETAKIFLGDAIKLLKNLENKND